MRRKRGTMSKRSTQNNNAGCLGVLGIILLFAFAIAIYSYFWIPAIGILIYCLKSKKFEQYKKRNAIICSIVIATSLAIFVWLNIPEQLDSIQAEWETTEFVVGDTIEIPIDVNPSDAEIKELEISKNNVATCKYIDGKATVTFKEPGEYNLFFIANETIKSDSQNIKIITQEEKAEQERIAAEKAEQERLAAEKAEQERLAAEKAEQERLAAEQAAQEQATIAQQNAEDPIVYITNTGAKYHNAGCRTLKSKIEKHLSEVQGVYEPCGICHPPQ